MATGGKRGLPSLLNSDADLRIVKPKKPLLFRDSPDPEFLACYDRASEPGKNAEPDDGPYPAHYVTQWKMRDGTPVMIRPIRPDDEPLMVRFHETLSETSVHQRYFGQLTLGQRTAHEHLSRDCRNDYSKEIALVADCVGKGEQHEIRGVGRLSRTPDTKDAEFAIVVSDAWQDHGLGTKLLKLLVEIGRREGLSRIFGHILSDNVEMQHVARRIGFELRFEDNEWRAEIVL